MMQRSCLIAALILAVPAGPALAIPGARPAFDCETSGRSWDFDGLYGPDTESAVRAYQEAKGLVADGICGMETAWSLRITYRQPLKCGMAGPDVLELQRALARAGYWRGRQVSRPAAPQPQARVTPKPQPLPSRPPVPPEEMMPPLPPDEVQPATPPAKQPTSPIVEEAPARQPVFELTAGTWMVPVTGAWFVPVVQGGSPNVDFSVVRQNAFGEVTAFWGHWGLGAGVQAFDLSSAVLPLGPYAQAGQLMVDGSLIYRLGDVRLMGGYRGFTQGGPHLASLGLGYDRALWSEWLWLRARLAGGSDFGSNWFYDGRAGLGLRFGALGLEAGFRHMGLPQAMVNGPTLGATLTF